MKIDINLLQEHRLNHSIYGQEDEDEFSELVEKIKSSGRITPLLVSRNNYTVLSGHRRLRAAKLLGYTEINIEFYTGDEAQELEILLVENFNREKTNSQKMKEAELYRVIEEKKAEERKRYAGMQNLGQSSVVEMVPPQNEYGKTRDIVGAKVGMSGKSYDRAKKVVERMDQEEDEGVKFFFGDVLDENIDAASKLADKPTEFILSVMEKTDDIKKVGSVIRELEYEEIKKKAHLPAGKFQVIYVDLTVKICDEIAKQPIPDHADQDSVLLLWVLPQGLEEGLKILNAWGFKYKTCMVWNQDFVDDISNKVEILMMGTKGNPPMMVENNLVDQKSEKPLKVTESIVRTYTGSKLEIYSDGFSIWRNA